MPKALYRPPTPATFDPTPLTFPPTPPTFPPAPSTFPPTPPTGRPMTRIRLTLTPTPCIACPYQSTRTPNVVPRYSTKAPFYATRRLRDLGFSFFYRISVRHIRCIASLLRRAASPSRQSFSAFGSTTADLSNLFRYPTGGIEVVFARRDRDPSPMSAKKFLRGATNRLTTATNCPRPSTKSRVAATRHAQRVPP